MDFQSNVTRMQIVVATSHAHSSSLAGNLCPQTSWAIDNAKVPCTANSSYTLSLQRICSRDIFFVHVGFQFIFRRSLQSKFQTTGFPFVIFIHGFRSTSTIVAFACTEIPCTSLVCAQSASATLSSCRCRFNRHRWRFASNVFFARGGHSTRQPVFRSLWACRSTPPTSFSRLCIVIILGSSLLFF